MKTACGYGRVSTQMQAVKGTSAKEQKKLITAEAKRLGYNLTKFYSDEGFSGKTIDDRDGLQQLINDAKSGKVQAVIFTKLDRLGRNLNDLTTVWNLLTEDLKLDLICIDSPAINTTDKMGKMMLGILGTFAEFEREMIRERTSGGRKIK